jgi:hypothetical protein
VDIKAQANPILSGIAVLFSSGALWTALSAANEIENKVVEGEAERGMIIRQQEVIRDEMQDYQKEQRAINAEQLKLLHQIKGQLGGN